MSEQADYRPGDIVNAHVWTGSEWVPVVLASDEQPDDYRVGSVVNGHAWTGEEWIPTREVGSTTAKKGFRERMEEAREELQRAEDEKRLAKLQDDPIYQRCGRVVAEGVVAGRTVKIYEKGYVRIGVLKVGPPEKLLGITASDMSQQKTGIGRAVVGVATLGANVLLTPNKRGSYYLVIVTDRKTHNLTMSPPTNSDLKAMHKLEAAGKTVLAGLAATDRSTDASPTTPAASGLADQLAQLAQLHAAGALTDDEFAAAKQRLIDPD
jgi:hypothetical protein